MIKVASNNSNHDKWKEYAEHRYADEVLESIRIRLVDICDKDDSLGDNRWPLSDAAIENIKRLICELQNVSSQQDDPADSNS